MPAQTLLPALILAGPPNRGKSALAYLLTSHLRQLKISHYLLRAAPDGEGDWFYRGDPAAVRGLRLRHRQGYNAPFIQHMRRAVEDRLLPLLVDVGGLPQGDQWEILRAGTHSVLLYGDAAELQTWQAGLAALGLQPLAELRSEPAGSDQLTLTHPLLQGVIGGLHRDESQRRTGVVFGALLERVAGIFRYTETELETLHLQRAPWPATHVRDLRPEAGEARDWNPEELPGALARLPQGERLALYGRGTGWLAAACAAHCAPAPVMLFDAALRLGAGPPGQAAGAGFPGAAPVRRSRGQPAVSGVAAGAGCPPGRPRAGWIQPAAEAA